ncbi:MAG: hypothetical protein KC503_07800 [Myxococcales bacterium]|nr:hypothetical protein [Myxococcales bacterium]
MRYALFAALVLASGTAAAAPASRWPLLSVGKNTRCGPFSKRALKRLPLLDGRLSIKAPRGSKDIPKTFSIMGAPEPKAHESRLLLDVAGTKLVVYVRELFHLAGGGYRKAARSYFFKAHRRPPAAFDLGRLAVSGGVRVLAARPKVPLRIGSEAALLLSTLVVSPDKTVQSVDFYVTPRVLKNKGSGCSAYATRLAKTIASGARKLDRAGGQRKLKALGVGLKLKLPRGFVITKKPARDFVVHFVRELAPFGQPASMLVLYVGGHPNRSMPRGPGKLSKQRSTLLGKGVEWSGRVSATSGLLKATVPLKPHLYLQAVAITRSGKARLQQLLAIAKTLRAAP